MKTLIVAALLGVFAGGGIAIAQTATGDAPLARGMRSDGRGMARLDSDGDGKISRAEYDAQSARRFARMDANGDGLIDASELQAAPMGRGAPPARRP